MDIEIQVVEGTNVDFTLYLWEYFYSVGRGLW